jgi:hypothetical protein
MESIADIKTAVPIVAVQKKREKGRASSKNLTLSFYKMPERYALKT